MRTVLDQHAIDDLFETLLRFVRIRERAVHTTFRTREGEFEAAAFKALFPLARRSMRSRDLAETIAEMSGAKVAYLPNPRKEADENDLIVKNDQFLALGLNPITLEEGLLSEVVDVARKYAHRIDRSRVPAVSAWTKDIARRVDHDPEGKRLKAV